MLVAVEERGVGYRLNSPFPEGELSGDMIITDVEDLVAGPVSRVIIRDPEQSAEDFVALAEELGLHGTNYVVGWTAWLDLSPVGVSKASGLAHVVEQLGLTDDDVLAIGDGRNDIEMLQWARPRRGDGAGDPGGDRRRRRRDRVGLRGRRRDRARTSLRMTPGLVATDLDGTLVRSDGTVSSATQELLATLDRRGVPVVFVTARPLRWMDDLWPMVGRHGMAIVSNGAILYDVAAGRARDVAGIDAAAGAALLRGHQRGSPRSCVRDRVRVRHPARPDVRRALRRAGREPGRKAPFSSPMNFFAVVR